MLESIRIRVTSKDDDAGAVFSPPARLRKSGVEIESDVFWSATHSVVGGLLPPTMKPARRNSSLSFFVCAHRLYGLVVDILPLWIISTVYENLSLYDIHYSMFIIFVKIKRKRHFCLHTSLIVKCRHLGVDHLPYMPVLLGIKYPCKRIMFCKIYLISYFIMFANDNKNAMISNMV